MPEAHARGAFGGGSGERVASGVLLAAVAAAAIAGCGTIRAGHGAARRQGDRPPAGTAVSRSTGTGTATGKSRQVPATAAPLRLGSEPVQSRFPGVGALPAGNLWGYCPPGFWKLYQMNHARRHQPPVLIAIPLACRYAAAHRPGGSAGTPRPAYLPLRLASTAAP